MKLIGDRKAQIDAMSYQELLRHWRFAKAGDPWFEGATGVYWKQRMAELRAENPALHVAASMNVGWEKP